MSNAYIILLGILNVFKGTPGNLIPPPNGMSNEEKLLYQLYRNLVLGYGDGNTVLIEDLTTAEINRQKILAPDGSGGTEWLVNPVGVFFQASISLPLAEVPSANRFVYNGSNNVTVTLPLESTVPSDYVIFIESQTTSNNRTVTIVTQGGDTLIGTTILSAGDMVRVNRSGVGEFTTVIIQTSLSVLSTASNIVYINNLSDLPTPVNNIITFADNTIYQFSGIVDIGANKILVGIGSKIQGNFSQIDGFTTSATGDIITDGGGVSIENITIQTAGNETQVFNLVSSTVGENIVSLDNVNVLSTKKLGVIQDYGLCVFKFCQFLNFNGGFDFSGVCDSLLITNNISSGFTGTFLDLGTTAFNAISIDENGCVLLGASSTWLEVAPNGANMNGSAVGSLLNNKIVNPTTLGSPIIGYTPFDLQWESLLNDPILSSDRATPAGWGFYVDNETAPVTQVFNTTPSKLQIDGAGSTSSELYLPKSIRGVDSFWDTTNDCIKPITEGDAYDIRVTVNIISDSGNPNVLECELDIGGGVSPSIVIVTQDLAVIKTPPYELVFTFPIFSLSTFIANGGQLFLNTDTGSVTVQARTILISRTSSGAS